MEKRTILCTTTTSLAKTLDTLEWNGFTVIRIEAIPHDFGGPTKYLVVYAG